jgi:hypothetical protein
MGHQAAPPEPTAPASSRGFTSLTDAVPSSPPIETSPTSVERIVHASDPSIPGGGQAPTTRSVHNRSSNPRSFVSTRIEMEPSPPVTSMI